jgi:hypothetical protein
VVRHPGNELHDYLQQSFTRLKHEQARELAATQGRAGEELGACGIRIDKKLSMPRLPSR